MCTQGGPLATHYCAKDSCCPDYHLVDQHLSSPAENAVCSMQLLSEGHLYSPPHAGLFSTELEKCGQWFYVGNESLLSLNHRNPLPWLLIGKNTHIFLGKDFHWRGMITSQVNIHPLALERLVCGVSLWQNAAPGPLSTHQLVVNLKYMCVSV